MGGCLIVKVGVLFCYRMFGYLRLLWLHSLEHSMEQKYGLSYDKYRHRESQSMFCYQFLHVLRSKLPPEVRQDTHLLDVTARPV